MKKLLLRLVDGQESEWSRIYYLTLLGFFSGIFIATSNVAISALFLTHIGDENDFPLALVGKGLLGIIATYFFNKLQIRIGFRKVIAYFLILMTLVLAAITFISLKEVTYHTIFIAYVVIGPFTIITGIVFWGIVGRIFLFRDAKRLTGGIDTGQASATIIAFFSIPLIEMVIPSTIYLLIISVVTLLCMTFVVIQMVRKFSFIEDEQSHHKVVRTLENVEVSSSKNRYASYVFLLSGFVICSSFAAAFVDYSFVVVTPEFFEHEIALTNFLAFFEGFVILVSFLIQSFLNDKIIEVFGIRGSLLFSVGILAFFGVMIVFTGHVFGTSPETELFIFFFLLVVMSKLMSASMKDALENPVMKFFFFPIDTAQRFKIQTFIDGTVTESAAFVVGLVMLAINALFHFDILYNIYAIFFILVGWSLIIYRLYDEYRRQLVGTLSGLNTQQERDIANDILDEFEAFGEGVDGVKKLQVVEWWGVNYLQDFLKQNALETEAEMDWLRKKLNDRSKGVIDGVRLEGNIVSAKDKAILEQDVLKSNSLILNSHSAESLKDLSVSADVEDRKKVASYLYYNYEEQYFHLLISLSRDYNHEVRNLIFLVIGKYRLFELFSILADHFANHESLSVLSKVMLDFGDEAVPLLENIFNETDQTQFVRLNILRLYKYLGSEEAVHKLIEKVLHPDRAVREAAMEELAFVEGWDEISERRPSIEAALMEEIAKMVWNINALVELDQKMKGASLLLEALELDMLKSKRRLFLYLGLLYTKDHISLVEKNIDTGTDDSIGYALELLDVLLEGDMKDKVIAVLDDASYEEKSKKLSDLFHREKYSAEQVLYKIINRETYALSRWTKACAMMVLAKNFDKVKEDDFVAHLYNTDTMLREVATWVLYKDNNRVLKDVIGREGSNQQQTIVSTINLTMVQDERIFNRVLLLKSIECFKDCSIDSLITIAESLQSVRFAEGEEVRLSQEEDTDQIFVVADGRMCLVGVSDRKMVINKGELISADVSYLFEDIKKWYFEANTTIYRFNMTSFANLLLYDNQLLENYLKSSLINYQIEE